MTTLTLSVASRDEVTRRALAAFEGHRQDAYISFASVELLWQTMTNARWELLKMMTGQGAISIHEVTRRTGRDMESVQSDVHALLSVGILSRMDDGRIVLPFDAVHVDFMLTAAA